MWPFASFPYLVAILVAMGMFRAAGGINLLSDALAPAMQAVGFPSQLLPMVLMRPLSGSGTLGMFAELVKQYGPDSLLSRMGGTIFGSTETTFYVLAVYFGSVAVKRTRYALPAGLIADTVGRHRLGDLLPASVWVSRTRSLLRRHFLRAFAAVDEE